MKVTKSRATRTLRPVTASTSVTANATRRNVKVNPRNKVNLTPEQNGFVRQLRHNMQRSQEAVTAATNTSNILARPDFIELLPLFVQKLFVLDVYGSVAMRSRQQLIPYFKFITENTKGETPAGTVLSSPFMNRQGADPNLTSRIVRNEVVAEGTDIKENSTLVYTPVLPGSVSITSAKQAGEIAVYTDGADGKLYDGEGSEKGTIDYATGAVTVTSLTGSEGDTLKASYEYDNETVGPDQFGAYGAKMVKGYLQLDEINLIAQAQELACYWSIYSAFAAQQEYGANIGDMAKEAAFAEITAEINSRAFAKLAETASYRPQFNWDASPVLSGAVVPSDYLKMFKLKLSQAASAIYQATRLSHPNRLIVGTNVDAYLKMIEGYQADTSEDTVGPYHSGSFDNFDVYCDPNYDPDLWVMACKSQDIRRCSALFGEYMPVTNTDAIGLANASVQQGYATMNAMEIVNPETVVSGKILGTY